MRVVFGVGQLRGAILVFAVAAGVAGEAYPQGVARFGVRTPMRDGVNLVSNLWLPDSTGRHPTILIRTPYDKSPQFRRYKLANYVRRGYAVLLQDTRGRGDSEGEFNFYFTEAKDGFDTIEWIAQQPWSNGRVGSDGGSYLGTVQWLAARERPPHLMCMVPTASSGRIFDEIPYQGGAFRLGWALDWLQLTSGKVSQSELNELVDWGSLLKERPIASLDERMGRRMPIYHDFLAHATFDDYWRQIQFDPADFARIEIPTLTVTGWYDGDQLGALYYWDGIEQRGPKRETSFLVVGPWTHAQTYLGGELKVGELEFPTLSILDIQGIRLAFFDWCLKGASPTFDSPRVRLFVTGSNRWRSFDRYPVPEVESRKLYLHSGGAANTLDGDGKLTWASPADEWPDRYSYNPKNPAPSRGSALDHRSTHRRDDALVYTSDELKEPVEVIGRVFVNLVAASDGKDTDFMAKLLDVFPDGRSVALGPTGIGVRRARYRNGYTKPELLTPNRAEKFSIELYDMAHTFLPGHRIRVEVSSSAAPEFDPNANTGLPFATDTTWRVARQTVYHDRARASHVVLPVVPLSK